MDRYAQLTQYYRTVQKRVYQQHWDEIVEIASNSNTTIFMREFYEYLFEHYQKQVKWCGTVFGASGQQEPIMVLVELLPFLQPSRETVINNLLKRTDDKLRALQDISEANVHFGRLMRNCLSDATTTVDVQQLKFLSSAIFDYFNAFIAKSVSFEQQWLATQMSELALVHPVAADSVRALGSANSKAFEWADAALKRCKNITQNCGIGPLVTVYTVCDTFIYIKLCIVYSPFSKESHPNNLEDSSQILAYRAQNLAEPSQICEGFYPNIVERTLKMADQYQNMGKYPNIRQIYRKWKNIRNNGESIPNLWGENANIWDNLTYFGMICQILGWFSIF